MEMDIQTERKIDSFFTRKRHTRFKAHIGASAKTKKSFVIDITPIVRQLTGCIPRGRDIYMLSPDEAAEFARVLDGLAKRIESGRYPVHDAATRQKEGSFSLKEFVFKYGYVPTHTVEDEMKRMDKEDGN